jgi:GNAT superfamily N-acetyltransferase
MNPNHETANLLMEAWRVFIPRLPTGTIEERDGVLAALGNVPLPFYNLAVADGPISDTDQMAERLETAKALADSCPYPWFFGLAEEWAPEGWETSVEDAGLASAMVIYGMVTDSLAEPVRPLPDLVIRRVEDERTARDIAEINGIAYGMPQEMIECICNMHLWEGPSAGFVGYVDGEPVSASATFPVAGTVYVALVATHPDHMRKGYGEAVMRRSVEVGQDEWGITRTSLHATDMGRPLYARMGYEREDRIHLITEPHPEE